MKSKGINSSKEKLEMLSENSLIDIIITNEIKGFKNKNTCKKIPRTFLVDSILKVKDKKKVENINEKIFELESKDIDIIKSSYTQIFNLEGEYKLKESMRSESNFISGLKHKAKELNLFYDEIDLINFHISMKSSNLVILAGMSGTGKSKLIKVYGEALGLSYEQINFIPVRPSWAEDSDLIGYVDSLHNVYVPGESGLINILLEADEKKDKIFIICLDEMNLARVEHYFSQFLSVLEMDKKNKILRLYNNDMGNKLYNANKYPSNILIGENVLFVGTVNIDESTYHFSDKVLDRANVINLTKQRFSAIEEQVEVQKSDLKEFHFSEYNNFINKSNKGLNENEAKLLDELHEKLNDLNKNFGIGFRVFKQISVYLLNIPDSSGISRQNGFDIQVVQRILTKIRGSQEQWEDVLGKYDFKSKVYKKGMLIDILERYSDVSNFEKSKKFIEVKAKELSIYGYTV